MDPVTAALNLVTELMRVRLAIFAALPDEQRAAEAVNMQRFAFLLQQFAHDIFPKFPAPPAMTP